MLSNLTLAPRLGTIEELSHPVIFHARFFALDLSRFLFVSDCFLLGLSLFGLFLGHKPDDCTTQGPNSKVPVAADFTLDLLQLAII